MGEWLDAGKGFDEWYARLYKCSLCGGEMIGCDWHFCPHCGQPMNAKEEEDA